MDLSTSYMGMHLRTPLVPSASPLSERIDDIRRMEDAGAAAVVLYSIFEEQLAPTSGELRRSLAVGASPSEALAFYPERGRAQTGPDDYLQHVRRAKQAVDIPIIASVNVTRPGVWTRFLGELEQAGADAIELNIYHVPTDLGQRGDQIEATYLETVKAARAAVQLPIAVKLSPYFTSIANMARNLDDGGVNALVLFNRFYQPDIDLMTLRVRPVLSLSTSDALRLPMRWISILSGRVRADLAATSGIHRAEDALKMIFVGANVVMMASALLRSGIDQIRVIEEAMRVWLIAHEYESLRVVQGCMSQRNHPDPSAFERAQYIQVLESYERR